MKKTLISICILLLYILTSSAAAFAAGEVTASVDLATATVTVSGTIPGVTEEPAALTLVSLNPGVDRSSLTESNFLQNVNYIAHLSTAEDGSYSYSYVMDGAAGSYQVFVVRADTEEVYDAPETFMYYSDRDLENIAGEFAGAAGAAAMEALLTAYGTILPTGSAEECAAVAAYLAKDKQVNGNFANYAALQRAYYEALIFEALSDAATAADFEQLMTDNEALLPFTSLDAYDAYENILDNEGRQTVLQALVNANVTHISEFASLFTERTILEAVKTMSNWRAMEGLLDKNRSTLTSLNYTKYDALCASDDNAAIDQAVIGKEFKTLEALCTAVNSAISDREETEEDEDEDGGSSSGDGSRGGLSSNSLISVFPTVETSEAPAVADEPSAGFTDMDQAVWAKDAVDYLTERGIISGRDAQTFAPNDAVTREEFVKMVVLAMDITGTSNGLPFTDVKSTHWHYNYIDSAYTQNVIQGVAEDLFGVGRNITREDMSVILCRVLEREAALEDGNTGFTDRAAIADYALESVQKLVQAGIIAGMDDGSFAPKANATRAQAATLLYNVLLYKEGK